MLFPVALSKLEMRQKNGSTSNYRLSFTVKTRTAYRYQNNFQRK